MKMNKRSTDPLAAWYFPEGRPKDALAYFKAEAVRLKRIEKQESIKGKPTPIFSHGRRMAEAMIKKLTIN